MPKKEAHVPMVFTVTELDQLLRYVEWRDEGNDAGWYYGNKAQFEKRHESIKKKIVAMLPHLTRRE